MHPALVVASLISAVPAFSQDDPDRPVAMSAALSPEKAALQMKVPAGFRVELVAGEPEVVQPIAYTMDDRGRLWVVENTNYPDAPGVAKDRVLIFESTKSDGKFDKRTIFWDKATFTSGIAYGFGGVWLGSPPNLLFIPDRNGDAVPDSEPVKVLDGWGSQDTHETLNNFIWGPDGWLYGTQGVFTESLVGPPNSPETARVPINAGIWRYHPTKKIFQRWAEGVSNQWGLDWNDRGEAFFAACVISHMWHGIEGAHYDRQAGSHFNPHTYENIKTIAWGNYEKAAYCGAMIYLGGAYPEEWRDCMFFHDIHMNSMRCEQLVKNGSGYRSQRKSDFLASPDAWFRGLSPQYGPDGSVFVNDWYDRVPCHQQRAFTDRSNGRIYRVAANMSAKTVRVDLTKASDAQLVAMQLDKNDWMVRHARRLLQERGPKPETTLALEKILFTNPDETRQLRALWALHSQGALSAESAIRALTQISEHVRGWAVTSICEDGKPSELLLGKLADLAKNDPSPIVRLRLASAAQKIEISQRWPLLEALGSHVEDAADRNLPQMNWYAADGAVASDPERGVAYLRSVRIGKLREFVSHRVTASLIDKDAKARKAMEDLVLTLARADSAFRRDVLSGILTGLKGIARLDEPNGWGVAYATLQSDRDEVVRDDARKLAMIFGSKAALRELRALLVESSASDEDRKSAIEALVIQRDQASLNPLLGLLARSSPLRVSAVRALRAFDDPRIATAILDRYAAFDEGEKQEALITLAARQQSTGKLLAAIDAGNLPRKDITAPLARVIQGFKDSTFDAWLEKNWGSLKVSSEDKQKEIEHFTKFLSPESITRADLKNGRTIFENHCAVCHTLFGKGGKIGPELTGSYADVDYLLQNILEPNAVIGKDYQQVFITTKNGELYAGNIIAEDANSITLKTLATTVTLPRSEIKSRETSANSMMPEGLLNGLEEPEVRDLFLYLRQAKAPKE